MRIRDAFLPVTAISRRDLVERIAQLCVGLWLYGVALALMVRGGIGVAPWDVLSLGIIRHTGMNYGVLTVLIAFAVLLLWIPLRERLGVGTLCNAVLVGVSAGVTLGMIPPMDSFWTGALLFVAGLVLLGFATALYITAEFGPGPRDGLMTGLVRCTGWPVWLVRTLIEGTVLLLGFVLGGPIGVGTVLFTVGVGPLIGLFLPWTRRLRAARVRQLRAQVR